MYKILLVCNAGMSTSMLVQRMEKAAEADGIDAKIIALPITDAATQLDEWDVIMLGPKDAIHYGNRLIMMNDGHIIYDVSGEEKKSLEISDLLKKFETADGSLSDKLLLS